VDGRSRVVGTWMVNDAAERQVALEGVGGFKNTTSSNIFCVAPALKFWCTYRTCQTWPADVKHYSIGAFWSCISFSILSLHKALKLSFAAFNIG